ncbi:MULTISPECIES: TetR/AcrR family transcriptional regulator [Mycobacteriaceae]|jgi:AcrR family transcriptional regulator|uniref:TetR family transcriptional regulator n=6 Tax=Mycobacterium TaxID=1763 RepID=A0A220XPM4_MYCIT|nr:MULTISPECIES: TetR/AcrR family transcriptional regulator [Mycobacteriaceae]ASL07714.1 TetR family transcriptional regulator [Mycobacterium intracellulare subsp. chimaera]ASL13368.1 TetR family transcriptional regulator [Mycobacterium intracellulare subsp. chimaera]ASL19503.1 TetR family transcriptional regulator [Mycobacterium intracellulare subsp. chimaera]ETZ40417.1 bacterial regulatory s, tetR family protein [Mycobacterium intracellulare MIN_052511_1280]KRQ27896.1 TetR family transcripti
MRSVRVYRGVSAEQRHQHRRTRLIDAAIELIGTRGVAATTVTAVCAESRVTSRYFYQHFSDRDALLRAVYQQLYATFQDVIVQAIPDAGAPPDVLAYAPIRALVNMIEDDPRLARILFVESATEPLLRELRSQLMAGFADLVLREARLHLDIADSAVGVAHLASTLGVGGLFEVLRRWLDGELDFSTDELVQHCAGFLGSLGTYVLLQNIGEAPVPESGASANALSARGHARRC